KD
ncbi:hypothetical protein D020_1479B, partial [Vibrio parahaemolyticus SBR10290]